MVKQWCLKLPSIFLFTSQYSATGRFCLFFFVVEAGSEYIFLTLIWIIIQKAKALNPHTRWHRVSHFWMKNSVCKLKSFRKINIYRGSSKVHLLNISQISDNDLCLQESYKKSSFKKVRRCNSTALASEGISISNCWIHSKDHKTLRFRRKFAFKFASDTN